MTSRLPSLAMAARRMALVGARRATPSLYHMSRVAFLSTQPKPSTGDYSQLQEQMETAEHLFETNLEVMDPQNRQQIQELQKLLRAAKQTYAVDAPDGETDGHIAEDLQDIQGLYQAETQEAWQDHVADLQTMFQTAAQHREELKEKLEDFKETLGPFAVDSPDGEVDGHVQEEMEEINHIIEDSHENKDKIEYQHKMEHAVRKERAKDPEHDW